MEWRIYMWGTPKVIAWAMLFSCCLMTACSQQANKSINPSENAIDSANSNSSNINSRATNQDAFTQTLYPIVSEFCSGCHSSIATIPAVPFFADPDPTLAGNELFSNHSVDLLNPSQSNIVVKVQAEAHNCWTVDCLADASVLEASIQELASLVNVGQASYATLCANCHGDNGRGTATTVGLTRTFDLTELTSLIETTMPTTDPTSCVGTCASDIAQFVFNNFSAANTLLVEDPLVGLPEGTEQLSLMCNELQTTGANNVVRDAFCNGAPPQIQGLTDLQAALGLAFSNPNATGRRNNGRRGNPAFTLTGHSSSLVARFVSAINPRAIIFNRANRVNGNLQPSPGFVAMGFVRGDQFAEVVTSDRVTGALTFFLVTFKNSCNLSNSCTPGDLLTPAIESNWVEYTVYSQTDLQNTILDCLQCHQPNGPGTGSILRMQELRNPWTHFFRNNRPGGVALLNDFVAAHGPNEDYAGIPAQLIEASDPAELEDLIVANGFNQPNEFRSRRIEGQVSASSPAQPQNNDIPGVSNTWQRIYNNTVQGQAIPVPYHDVKVTDSAKLASLTASYRAFVNGTLAAADLPDIRDVFLDSMLPDIGFRVMSGLDGQQVITQACTQCHNSQLNQSISRARFNVNIANMSDTQGGVLSGAALDAEISLAITRLNLPAEDVRRMPPEQFKTLDTAEIQAASSYLCSIMTVPDGQCANIPAFVASPAPLPPAGGGGGRFGGAIGPGAGGAGTPPTTPPPNDDD